jgi:DNA mismatch repair protein MutL
MPKINLLPPQLADMIAAGEVVERPASAVKELLENAVDAGAKNITAEIRAGGAEYIRVTDDGCGMAPEDAGVAFLRHATSKLRDERGLEAIGTLGFRGEALAAIGAVSHVELMTRERGAAQGTRLTLSGGDIEEMGACGCPEGTTLVVRGLFYNTPARLKFMKSDRAEGAACAAAALRVALGHPEVSVRCIRDGEEVFFTAGDGRAASAVYSLLGREAAASLLPAASQDGGVSASGFVSAPSAGRGSRAGQYFFCNGRYIRSQLLQSAVEQAYRNTLLVGKYPACVLYLTLAPGSVDVNVHPAKTEVKFSDEKRVFDAAYYAALGALEEKRPPAAALSPRPEDARSRPAAAPAAAAPVSAAPASGAGAGFRQPQAYYQTRLETPPAPPSAPRSGAEAFRAPAPSRPAERPAPAPEVPAKAEAEVRVIGEALGLYILAEQNGALLVIDKHAAHERILFDRLKARGGQMMSQTLLVPVPVHPGAEGGELLEQNAALIAALGFQAEPYGAEAWVLRAVPDGVDAADAAAALEETLDTLRKNRRLSPDALRDEALKTVACRAAVKAGRSSQPEELLALARAVCSGEVRYCPHGRPVSWTLTRQDLDRQFRRIV